MKAWSEGYANEWKEIQRDYASMAPVDLGSMGYEGINAHWVTQETWSKAYYEDSGPLWKFCLPVFDQQSGSKKGVTLSLWLRPCIRTASRLISTGHGMRHGRSPGSTSTAWHRLLALNRLSKTGLSSFGALCSGNSSSHRSHIAFGLKGVMLRPSSELFSSSPPTLPSLSARLIFC